MTEKRNGCRCNECKGIHSEFIMHFDRWPNMSHEDALKLKEGREGNLRSWELAVEMTNGDALFTRKAQ